CGWWHSAGGARSAGFQRHSCPTLHHLLLRSRARPNIESQRGHSIRAVPLHALVKFSRPCRRATVPSLLSGQFCDTHFRMLPHSFGVEVWNDSGQAYSWYACTACGRWPDDRDGCPNAHARVLHSDVSITFDGAIWRYGLLRDGTLYLRHTLS